MTTRSLNLSLAFRLVAAAQLLRRPTCDCGAPAKEAHLATSTSGCRGAEPPYDSSALISVCRTCHDKTGCTLPPPSTPLMRLIEESIA
jgi:hypothetical protein